MEANSPTTYWTPDAKTYQELQKLKKFVDFVAGLEHVSPEEKSNAEIIKQQIENFNQPYPTKYWNVSFNIYGFNLPESNKKDARNNCSWRNWHVSFEHDDLEIEAFYQTLEKEKYEDLESSNKDSSTNKTVEDNYYTDDHTTYYTQIYFKKDIPCERMYMETDINEFIADAMNYKSYINESLNEIEVNIEIWDIH